MLTHKNPTCVKKLCYYFMEVKSVILGEMLYEFDLLTFAKDYVWLVVKHKILSCFISCYEVIKNE